MDFGDIDSDLNISYVVFADWHLKKSMALVTVPLSLIRKWGDRFLTVQFSSDVTNDTLVDRLTHPSTSS